MSIMAPQHQFIAWVPREWADQSDDALLGLPSHVELRLTQPGLHHKFLDENAFMRRTLKRWNADVLFSLGDTSLPLCPVPHLLLIQQAHLAYAAKERGFPMPLSQALRWRLMEAYLRACLPTVTKVVVQTEDMKDRLCRRYRLPPQNVAVVPSSAELPREEEAPCSSEEPYVCYVASGGHHKNHTILASMMAALRERHPSLVCRLTVDKSEVPALNREIERRSLASRFRFEGTVPHAAAIRLMRDAWAVVIPSKLESFGLPYYEALSVGVPIVAADRAFAREACGDAAFYADADDGLAFADAIDRIVSSRALEGRLREAARRRFEDHNRSWSDIAGEYLRLLGEAAGQRR
jgi:glycosyltransferase involved in cell wall biosynthesis